MIVVVNNAPRVAFVGVAALQFPLGAVIRSPNALDLDALLGSPIRFSAWQY
jgi:hypothetical protein